MRWERLQSPMSLGRVLVSMLGTMGSHRRFQAGEVSAQGEGKSLALSDTIMGTGPTQLWPLLSLLCHSPRPPSHHYMLHTP